MKKILKYTLRIFAGIIIAIVLLTGIAVLLTQTRFFKQKLPAIIEKQTADILNGDLTLGRIEGNFFTGIDLFDVLLKQQSDTIIYVEKIKANYRLLPLLRNKLEVHSLELRKPYVYAQQNNDSVWNLQQLVKPSPTTEKDTVSGPSSFSIDLARLSIIEGQVRVASPDSVIPEKIDDLNTELAFSYSSEKQEVSINQFNLKTHTPDFTLQQLTLQIIRNGQEIQLNNFRLKTARNELNAEGEYQPEPVLRANADIRTAPLEIKEFEFFLPDLKIPSTPVFRLDAQARNDSLLAVVELAEGNEKVKIDLQLAHFPAVLYNRTDTMIRYELTAVLNEIGLAHWTGKNNLNHVLNGKLTARGVGINPETLSASIRGNFNGSRIDNKHFDQLQFNLSANQGNAKGTLTAAGGFGKLIVDPEVRSFMSSRPSYHANVIAEHLDLARLTGKDTLKSNLNIRAVLSGRGFDPNTLSAKAKIEAAPSQLASIELDTLFAEAAYSGKNVHVDTLLLKTQSVQAFAHGNYSINSASDLTFRVNLESLAEIQRFIPLEAAQTSGFIRGRLQGTPDSLKLVALAELSKTEFDSIFADSIRLSANARVVRGDTTVNAQLTALNLRNASMRLDSVTANVEAGLDSATIAARVSNQDLNTEVNAAISWTENLKVRLNNWNIDYIDQTWALQKPPATFQMDSTSYQLQNFMLARSSADSSAQITANGTISRKGNEDFAVELKNINLAEMAKTFYREIDVSGKLNLALALEGTAASPQVTGSFGIEKPVFNAYEIAEMGGEIDYRSDLLDFSTRIVPRDSGRIELTGKLPVLLRLDSIRYKIDSTDAIDAHLIVDRFPLAILQAMELTEEIEGYLDGEITVDGTVKRPNPEGQLQLQDAAFRMSQYGIDYRQIDFKVDFLRNKINLDTFRIQTSDGHMTAGGQIDFSSDFYKGDVSNTNILVQFDQFNPVDHRQLNMQLNGKATLAGKKGDVQFGGDLNIPQAEVYLPFVMNLMGKFSAPEMPKPILLQELQKSGEWQDTMQITQVEKINPPDSIGSTYFENFTGKLNIKIPKNTWVKNEDFRIELSGDLELLKNNAFFELFGTVDVVRGQYDLFGRTFIIDQGTVSFRGGEEIQPELNITANYAFRNAQRAEQELTVNISGTASSPKVNFTLDGSAINEGDALSYIVFGRSLNELTMSQQDNISGGGGGSLAESAAASMLSAQISKFLGDKLDVDYIEVKSDGGFENATVTVGKYITNDLFVNYEQQFGETSRKDVDRYRVELEYELFKFLFIQLNNSSTDSGFNIILKLNAQ